jgi:pyruvate dehydrogenase E2 component (dihydrolipoamide acetyltransferase)
MPIEIIIPRLGWSMEEGNFVNWLKKDGEGVKSGELLFSLENEKAVQEVEAIDSGILRIPEDGPKPGQSVKVGQVIGHLLAEGESRETGAAVEKEAARESGSETSFDAAGKTLASSHEENPQPVSKPAISPRARRLAAELGVDTASLRGTGPGGRITEKDVRDAAK